jgi:hypothetical protein
MMKSRSGAYFEKSDPSFMCDALTDLLLKSN